MATQTEPYVEHKPGDLVSAAVMNKVQVDIKEDIQAAKEAAKEEIREEGVNNAGNAEKFSDKTEGEWIDSLDERYAPKIHDHEETAAYRRYIKRLTRDDSVALIEHGLGRYPLVDVYELLEVVGVGNEEKRREMENAADPNVELLRCKLFVYYHHREADKYGMRINIHRNRFNLGVPLEAFLEEYEVKYEDDDTIGDVLNDMLEAFMHANDELDHYRSDWMEKVTQDRRKVSELKEADEWPDIHVAMLPRQVCNCCVVNKVNVVINDRNLEIDVKRRLDIAHGNYDTLAVFVSDDPEFGEVDADISHDDLVRAVEDKLPPIDVMLLLRS